MNLNNGTPLNEVIIAEVVFDSSCQPAGAGFRGPTSPFGSCEPRHVILRTLNVDIHVRLSGSNGHASLMGQVLSRRGLGAVQDANVHLLVNGKHLTSAKPDRLGEFRFQDVPNEGLSLQVDLSSLTLIGSLRTPNPVTKFM